MQSPFASGAFEQYPKFPDASQQIALFDWIVALEAKVMFPVALKLPTTLNLSDGAVVPMPTVHVSFIYAVLILYLLDVLITNEFTIFSLVSILLLCKNLIAPYCDSIL